jgi:hypothetical protein
MTPVPATHGTVNISRSLNNSQRKIKIASKLWRAGADTHRAIGCKTALLDGRSH